MTPAFPSGPAASPEALFLSFCGDVGRAGDDPQARAAFDRILEAYAQPHRRYHGARHVRAVVAGVDVLLAAAGASSAAVAQAPAIRLAAWYHDAVYDPRSTENEPESARMAAADLAALGVAADIVDTVQQLILATRTHTADSAAAAILLDADLAVLASPTDVYDRYSADVRAEFGFVGDDDWRRGRSAVLSSFLARARIYFTPTGQAWEPVARGNLSRERAGLQP